MVAFPVIRTALISLITSTMSPYELKSDRIFCETLVFKTMFIPILPASLLNDCLSESGATRESLFISLHDEINNNAVKVSVIKRIFCIEPPSYL